MTEEITVRAAEMADLDALVDMESRCFDSDQISKRQFRYLLTRANASVMVAERQGMLLGDAVVLFSRATSVARLYSLAVDMEARGRGVGTRLIKAAEKEAWSHSRAYLRLEVRKDNQAALRLYESLGYRRLGELAHYYEDQMDAWRLEKSLAPDLNPELAPVPFYEQSLDFTCGAASLMMAMKGLNPALEMSRSLELRLWREATTIFMTSGHGGCGPYGLALAATRRGFPVEVCVTDEGIHLVDSVRSQKKKEVMRLVQEEMYEELRNLKVPLIHGNIGVADIKACFDRGGLPLVLISSWQIYQARVPHWVVVTGFDEHFVYINDPFIDREKGETMIDSINMPIPKDQFERMARYGRAGLQAMVVLYPGAAD
jgi:ribosomal protein S18 acetylase RimI-like enzyme